MARIKSAWEIALERTENIKADPEKLQKKEQVNEGRRLAASFLADDASLSSVEKAIEESEHKELLLEGVITTLEDNISLPRSELYAQSFERVQQLATLLHTPEVETLLAQLRQFFDQYLTQQEQMTEQARQQYMPRMQQKEREFMEQYGTEVHLQPEQDPEFLKMLEEMIRQLDAQYNQVIKEAKQEIETICKKAQ